MREDVELYKAALNCAKAGDWAATITKLYQSIALKPDEAKYHSLLAVAYLGCLTMKIPVSQVNPALDEDQAASVIYTKLAKRTFYNTFLIDPGDPLLGRYMQWLFGLSDNNDLPPNDDSPNLDRSPKPSPPNLPIGSAAEGNHQKNCDRATMIAHLTCGY